MPEITVIIPIGPYHEKQAERAIESARAQTLPVIVDPILDRNGYGPGYARNVGIDRCQTKYVIFLDADDWLEDEAARVWLFHAQSYPDHYIYSDWWVMEDRVIQAPEPCDAWRGGTVNNLTSLVPTEWARKVGGFDQELGGGEDTDFFLKLITGGCCGIRVDVPLVHYAPDGKRSQDYLNSPEHARVHALLTERYANMAGCCDDRQINEQTTNEKQDGDVLVVPMWGGNQKYTGRATRRHYGRQGNQNPFWADPADVPASRRPLTLELLREPLGPRKVTQPVGQGGQRVTVDQTHIPHGVHETGAHFLGRMQASAGARYTPPNAVVQRPLTIEAIQQMGLEDDDDE